MPPRPLADKVTNGWRELASIFEELQRQYAVKDASSGQNSSLTPFPRFMMAMIFCLGIFRSIISRTVSSSRVPSNLWALDREKMQWASVACRFSPFITHDASNLRFSSDPKLKTSHHNQKATTSKSCHSKSSSMPKTTKLTFAAIAERLLLQLQTSSSYVDNLPHPCCP